MSKVEQIKAALLGLLNRDQRNTCQHEETYRGGSIWEICRGCGQKWSDDRDPKPEWVDPPEWAAGYAAIDALEALAQPAGEAEPVYWHDEEIGELYLPSDNRPEGCRPLYTTPQQSQPLTDEQILAGAREMNKLECDVCGIDEEDSWKLYGNSYIIDAATVLRAAHDIKKGGTE